MVQTQADNGKCSRIYGILFKRDSLKKNFLEGSKHWDNKNLTPIWQDKTWILTFQNVQNL